MGKRYLIISPYEDPYLHLAWEQSLLNSLDGSSEFFLLYRNRPCVVMGRFQHPLKEIYLPRLRQMDLELVRRFSGGGTVYHDLGNLNFSLIHPDPFLPDGQALDIMISSLGNLGVPLLKNERRDLVLKQQGKVFKVSGSAFKRVRAGKLHHGTLLLDAHLGSLRGVLGQAEFEFKSKALASTPSPVINLNQVFPDLKTEDIYHSIKKVYRPDIFIDETSLDLSNLRQEADQFDSEAWRWQESPKAEISAVNTGLGLNIQMKLEKGKVHTVEFHGQNWPEQINQFIQKQLEGRAFHQLNSWYDRADDFGLEEILKEEWKQFLAWFANLF
jgi:lipoate-protein ligase A